MVFECDNIYKFTNAATFTNGLISDINEFEVHNSL